MAIGAVVILVALAIAGYYASTQYQGGDIASQLGSLKSEVTSLQQSNQVLQSQLASISSGSNQSSTASTTLYSSAIASVVTIKVYSQTGANFALGILIMMLALLLESLFNSPIILGFVGRYSTEFGPYLSSGDIFTIAAYSIFLYLSLE